MLRTTGIALLCLFAVAPRHARADAEFRVVKEGDALSLIAQETGVSVQELKEWNGLNSDLIRVGQKLIVARSKEPSVEEGIDWTPPFDYGSAPAATPEAHSPPVAARDPSSAIAVQPKKGKRSRTYRVQPGDTLTGIAQKFETSITELIESNPGIDPDRIYPGETIDIGEPKPEVFLTLERGDTLLAVASRYDVAMRDVSRWNRGLNQSSARPGAEVRLYTRVPVSPSEAIGPTNRGRLENGVRLPSHRSYVMRSPERAYGTEETIRWIVAAFDGVEANFKGTRVVRVHDISDRNGGRIRDHKSHQNGRDADMSYFQKDCGPKACPFSDVRPSELDVARQWTLLEYWLRHGQAELIFIDYRLQSKLYRYAKRKGVTKAQLDRWLQYPRGRYEPVGVIRHYPNHEDHLHVRFVCPYSDLKCRP